MGAFVASSDVNLVLIPAVSVCNNATGRKTTVSLVGPNSRDRRPVIGGCAGCLQPAARQV